jgi:L-amino acid N-acyltransferase YncA
MVYQFEPLGERHRTAVIDIFNHFITQTLSAYYDQALEYAFFDRLLEMVKGYPALAVIDEAGAIVGFGALHRWHPAAPFNRTAEISYFFAPPATGRGIGTALLARLEDEARAMGVETILASISSRNEGSLRFHQRHGFRECGRFERVGRKFDTDFDVVWMQKKIERRPA